MSQKTVVGTTSGLKKHGVYRTVANLPEAVEGHGRPEHKVSRLKSTHVQVDSTLSPTLCPSVEGCRSGILHFIRTRKGMLAIMLVMALLALIVYTVSADIIMEKEIGSTIRSGHQAIKNLIKNPKQ